MAREVGVAAAGIRRSDHLDQAGAYAECLANQGLVAIVFSDTPKAITFWGGKKPMKGTNPIALAAPRAGNAPLVIDMSLSKVARGKILAALTGSRFGHEAGSFFDGEGRAFNVGHLLIFFSPDTVSGSNFAGCLADILDEAEAAAGARLPGSGRLANRARADSAGLAIAAPLIADIKNIIRTGAVDG